MCDILCKIKLGGVKVKDWVNRFKGFFGMFAMPIFMAAIMGAVIVIMLAIKEFDDKGGIGALATQMFRQIFKRGI